MRPEFADYYCGCDPRGENRCPEGLRFKGDMLATHLGIAEVCLGLRPIRSLQDVPQLPRGRNEFDVEWTRLESVVQDHLKTDGLDLEPRFQRGHVWTEAQQAAYVQAMLQGCEVSRTLIFNHYCWEYGDLPLPYPHGTMVIVDGKQRLQAVRRFMNDDLRVFGLRRSEFAGQFRLSNARFHFRIMVMPDEPAVLRLYLALNAGGTPHTADELDRVRAMLAG